MTEGKRGRSPRLRRAAALLVGLLLAFLIWGWLYVWPWPRFIPVLTYHSVVPRVLMERTNPVFISTERFTEQIRFLKSHGYQTITPRQLEAFLAGDRTGLPRRPVMITFDDGYEDNYSEARPVLRSVGFSGLVSVIGRCIDEATAGSQVAPGLRYLTWDQLRTMSDEGTFEVGSHTYDSHHDVAIDARGTAASALTHRRFLWDKGRLETEEEYRSRLAADFQRSRDGITAAVGRAPTVITYPYGTSNGAVEEAARAAGFHLGLSTVRGFNLRSSPPMRVRRITVTERDGPLLFAFKLSPAHYVRDLFLEFCRRHGWLKEY
ncbi:MAG TPA: polysaccharide deacetylase family protein [Bacillota bacterium]